MQSAATSPRANDGKTLAAIDLEEIRHKPLPARSPRDHRAVTDVVATLKARGAQLEAELAQAEERSRGHRRTTSASVDAPTAGQYFSAVSALFCIDPDSTSMHD